MDLRPLGLTGVAISRIGLGGVEFGPEAGERADPQNAARVIEIARDNGINWLDTSENYYDRKNEVLIGEALQRVDGEFLVSTKVAPRPGNSGGGSGFRAEQVHAACRGSLQRLGLDQLDIYLLHWPDDTGIPLEETWSAMSELAQQGLVRAIGMSNYFLEQIEKCHEQRPVDVIQTGFSLIDYLDDRPIISGCGELGIPVTVYEPMASGVLTGLSLDAVRARWAAWEEASFYKRLLSPGKGERSIAVADGLRPIAEHLGATVAQVAIAWVLHQPGVTAALAGTRSGNHMTENAAAADLDLTGMLDRIEALIPLGPAFA